MKAIGIGLLNLVMIISLAVMGSMLATKGAYASDVSGGRSVSAGAQAPDSAPQRKEHTHEGHTHEPLKEPQNQAPMDHDHHAMRSGSTGAVWSAMDTRNASGTSWQPKSTPESMAHLMASGWIFMLHSNAFASVNRQGGPRGITKFESLNWGMIMAEHALGPGTFAARMMLSLEPLTFSPGGSPQLFQTGETYQNRPLVDRQHPHNFFMELAAMYTFPVAEKTALQIYSGPVGEPALGPTAFMHRLSASELPAAPLGHHLADSTHISEGVVTLGLIHGPVKVEASAFNGHEPGEERWGIHTSGLNSYSFRTTLNPTEQWSGQFSIGHLRKPEAAEPGNVVRSTASITYNRSFAEGNWATTALWGRNRERHAHLNGYLLESTLNFQRSNYLYARWELVDRLGLLGDRGNERQDVDAGPSFRVSAYTFGVVRDIPMIPGMRTGIGGDITFYSKPSALDTLYGKSPVSFHVFLRLRPRSKH